MLYQAVLPFNKSIGLNTMREVCWMRLCQVPLTVGAPVSRTGM